MRGLVGAMAVWAALVVPAQADAAVATAPDPQPGQLTFARDLELRGGQHPRIGERRVVYSVRLPGLDASERLKLRAEVELTTCERSSKPQWRCGTPALHPRVDAWLVLRGRGKAQDRQLAHDGTTCDRHHCPLVLSRTLDGAAKATHVDLVIDSSAAGADGDDEIEIKTSKTLKGGGFLSVMRAGAGYADEADAVSVDGNAQLPIETGAGNPKPEKKVVLSIPVTGLQRGEILDVEAALDVTMDPRVRANGVPAVFASQVILADSPTQTEATQLPHWRRIALNTGFNCPATCTARKVGAIEVEQPLGGTTHVNYVALASRTTKRVDQACNDSCKASIDGALTVRRLAPQASVAPPPPPKEPGEPPRAPEAVTTDTANAKCRTVTLRGLVDPRGAETSYRFVWKRVDGDERHYSPWRPAGAGRERVEVSEPVEGLVPDREYEVKLIAESAGGRAEGDWRRFRTFCPE